MEIEAGFENVMSVGRGDSIAVLRLSGQLHSAGGMTLDRNNHPKKLDFRQRLGRKVIGSGKSDVRIVTGHLD